MTGRIIILTYLPTKMRNFFSRNAGNFIRTNLIWGVDIGDSSSYPGTGSTITDIVGTVNMTLSGTYSYVSSPPSISLNASLGASTTNAATLQINTGTIIVWARPTNGNTGFRGMLTKENAYGIFVVDNKLAIYDWGSGATRDSGLVVGNSTWQMFSLTFSAIGTGTPSNNAILYRNGQVAMTTTLKLNNQATAGVSLGSNNGNQGFIGNISSAYIYNSVLSQPEILAHYNATKIRFSL